MGPQFFTSLWYSEYQNKTKKELGYEPGKGYTLNQLKVQKATQAYEKFLIQGYNYDTLVDMKEISENRVVEFRKQRYIFELNIEKLRHLISSSLATEIREILWLHKSSGLFVLNDGKYVLLQNGEAFFSFDFSEIILNKMTPITYYLYIIETDPLSDLFTPRFYNIKYQSIYNLDDVLFLKNKLDDINLTPELSLYTDFIDHNENIEFDYLQNFVKVFWCYLNFKSGRKSYIFYKTNNDIYTLIKFNTRIDKGKLLIRWIKVYLSFEYKWIVDKCMTGNEYNIYFNTL
jgi:hypothetical protein